MPAPSSFTHEADSASARPTAMKPDKIADMFNTYFASVFTSIKLPDPSKETSTDHYMTQLILSELEVEHTPKSLDSNKATEPDEISARLLKLTASLTALSFLFWLLLTDLGTPVDCSHQHVGKHSETRGKVHLKIAIFDRR